MLFEEIQPVRSDVKIPLCEKLAEENTTRVKNGMRMAAMKLMGWVFVRRRIEKPSKLWNSETAFEHEFQKRISNQIFFSSKENCSVFFVFC